MGPTSPVPRIRARQVHLDFHNSEAIPDLGARFDRRQFQEALRRGRVNHVNVFARCAQGWSYYPTAAGSVHPTLRRDLLGEMIGACREIDVRAPVYYCVGFSEHDLDVHPDWAARGRDGTPATAFFDPKAGPSEPRPAFAWRFLCPTGGYRDLVLAQLREICGAYPVDGFWIDVCDCSGPCHCPRCLAAMEAAGLDPRSDADARLQADRTWESFFEACNGIIHGPHPGASVYYNGTTSWGHDYSRFMTQLEFEDMPSASGGYDRLPLRCKAYARAGLPTVGMTGKFHTSWGEFGGFKPAAVLRHEAALNISLGAATSMGDQMDPSGLMDMETYRLIGEAFSYLEQVEDLGLESEMAASLGLWISGELPHDQGVATMLMEGHVDYEAVGPRTDLGRFDAVVLPGGRCLDETSAEALEAFRARGGGLLVLGESALDAARGRFLLDVGAAYAGPAAYEVDFIEPGPALARGLVSSPIVCTVPTLRSVLGDGEPLAAIREPWFNRTYGRFCSHQHFPARPGRADHPGGVQKGSLVFLPHPFGRMYLEGGAHMHREMFLHALRLVHRAPMVETSLPSAGRVNLLRQPARARYVAHLLYAPPLARGRCLVIDDMPELRDVPLRLRVPERVTRAWLAPQGTRLRVRREGAAAAVVVPRLVSHQAVVFEYRDGRGSRAIAP